MSLERLHSQLADSVTQNEEVLTTSTSATKLEQLRSKLLRTRTERAETRIRSEIEEIQKCPHCGCEQLVIDYARGEVICPRCGTVVAEHLVDITRPEYRVFTPEDVLERERVQRVDLKAPELDLGQDEIDVVHASPQLRPLLERISKINKRLRIGSQERNIVTLERIVKNLVQKLGLQPVLVDDVVYMYRQLSRVLERRMFRLRELAIALLYIACKKRGLSFRFREILQEANISRKRFGKLVNTVKQLLQKTCGVLVAHPVINENEIKAYIYRIMDNLNIPENPDGVKLTIARLTLDLVRKCRDAHITNGRSIHSIVAAAIYIVLTLLNLKRKQKDVAVAANVSDVTIRARYREIMDKLNIVIYV